MPWRAGSPVRKPSTFLRDPAQIGPVDPALAGALGSYALLGVLVIQAISNGLTLLNLSSSLRYMITGGVLAIAVIVDSLARRSRASHGRA